MCFDQNQFCKCGQSILTHCLNRSDLIYRVFLKQNKLKIITQKRFRKLISFMVLFIYFFYKMSKNISNVIKKEDPHVYNQKYYCSMQRQQPPEKACVCFLQKMKAKVNSFSKQNVFFLLRVFVCCVVLSMKMMAGLLKFIKYVSGSKTDCLSSHKKDRCGHSFVFNKLIWFDIFFLKL